MDSKRATPAITTTYRSLGDAASKVAAVDTPSNDREPKAPAPNPSRRSRSIGVIVGLVGLAFAAYAVYLSRDELTGADLDAAVLLAAMGIGLAGMFTVGANWLRIMRKLGATVPSLGGMRWYYVGQLGKYIPGGLWAVLGRSELASRDGVARSIAYPSVAMSLITTYAAAAATGGLFLAFGSSGAAGKAGWLVGSLAMIGITVAVLSEAVIGRINALTSRFGTTVTLPSASPRLSSTAIALTMPAWVAIGAATSVTASALGFDPDTVDVVAATSYAWLAGFLVLPLPGGLGVREAVFIALWGGPASEAAAIAVLARIVFILVDLTGAAVSSIADGASKRRVSGSR